MTNHATINSYKDIVFLPGVCVPLDAEKCSGHAEFVECKDPTVFDCPAIEAAGK